MRKYQENMNKQNELISVIIPIYNVEKYLKRCIDSVLNQTYKEIEVILIDDGSPDNCGKICDYYKEKDKRVIVIHKINGGLSDARNVGLNVATGKYITFIDSDDFVEKGYIEVLYKLIKKYNCQISQCSYVKGSQQKFRKRKSKKEYVYFRNDFFKDRKIKITVWAKLYKKDLFQNLRFPVNKINEDEFITYKILDKVKKIAITDGKYYYYYQSPDSIMRKQSNFIKEDIIEAFQERIEYFANKEERRDVLISEKEFLLRLIMLIIKCEKNPNNQNDKIKLRKLFEKYYKNINNRYVKLNERIFIEMFYRFPNISIKILKKIY